MRYFLARIYQFQFHRALCKAAGHKGPLHAVLDLRQQGRRASELAAMLQLGASKPWPEALAALTGRAQADASAMLEYFAPLRTWLAGAEQGPAVRLVMRRA